MSQQIQRSRNRAVLFSALAVFVAVSTAFTAWSIIKGYERSLVEVKASVAERQVVVASRDLNPGQVIAAADLALTPRPGNVDGDKVFTSVKDAVGQISGDRILSGEIIRKERLVSGGARLQVSELIEEGMRAVTVRASRASAVGGLIKPGNHVDVIVTIKPDTNALNADWVTETIIQGVRVVAIGDDLDGQPEEEEEPTKKSSKERAPREVWVTLEVAPAEAEHVALACARGEIHLALRPRDDFSLLEPGKPLVTNALLGLPMPVQAAQAERLARKSSAVGTGRTPVPSEPSGDGIHVTETIRGGLMTTERFDEKGNHIIPAASRR